MPGSSKAKHPRGWDIEFFEDSHKYVSVINGQEVKYISGTQFLHKFFKPFDPDGEIARRCAVKEGCTVDEIKEKWAKAGREASALGTKVHECCEDIELGRKELRNKPTNDKEAKMMEHAVSMAKRFYSGFDILGVEKIVFSPSLKIAGTIDLFARSKKDGTYIIGDHKTNKSIDLEDKWNKFALPPISHLHDINGVHYGLQLSLYEYLLKREGYVPRDAKFKRFLNHITVDGAKLIPLPDYSLEIRDMFISHLTGEI
jgi:hypothetical protein